MLGVGRCSVEAQIQALYNILTLDFKNHRLLNICLDSQLPRLKCLLSIYRSWFCFVKNGGLNENAASRLMYLNAWSKVAGTVWEGLRNMALLEVCHWVQESWHAPPTCFRCALSYLFLNKKIFFQTGVHHITLANLTLAMYADQVPSISVIHTLLLSCVLRLMACITMSIYIKTNNWNHYYYVYLCVHMWTSESNLENRFSF